MPRLSRRELLASGALAGATVLSPAWLRAALAAPAQAGPGPYGDLQPPDANGLMLPPGFTSRQIARGLQPVPGTNYALPIFPDGQATFRTLDGGWILVTNSESLAANGAGTSAIRFAPNGAIRSAYRILGDTNINCAGGPTRWGTWLSCEENDSGLVWETDPAGVLAAQPRPALGLFNHEAAAVDPVRGCLYLTEDEGDGGFYRFVPTRYPHLSSGRLEVAVVGAGGAVTWVRVPDPSTAGGVPTREQVPGMTKFDGGEGIWYARGVAYFTTKGDKRVWAFDAVAQRIGVIFDRGQAPNSSLDAVDNVTVTPVGEIFVCEDGGNMEIGLIDGGQTVSPFLRFTENAHANSEVAGVVFDPSHTRLYCTSQRAFPVIGGNSPGPGAIYEITGPFRSAAAGVPPDFIFGPPAGELRAGGTLIPGGDATAPAVRVRIPRRVRRSRLSRRGLPVRLRSNEPVEVKLRFLSHDLRLRRGKGGSSARPVAVTLAKGTTRIERSQELRKLRLKLPKRGRKRMRRRLRSFRGRLVVRARDAAGNETVVVRRVRVGRSSRKKR